MDIICILAGGAGNRFGSPVPKQYHLINGRPVIEYAIDAAVKCRADEVVVVANRDRISDLEEKYGVTVIEGGKNRNASIQNALEHIDQHYQCGKLILLDAVCPLITAGMLNLYLEQLNTYDAVFTVADITTNLARYDGTPVDRKEFFLVESPDAYRYDIIRKYFDKDSRYASPLHMLPETCSIQYYREFRDYMKVMYPHDLAVAEALIRERERHVFFEAHANDTVLRLLAKLRKMDREGTRAWEKKIDEDIAELFARWEIYSFEVNQDAYTGMVLECQSRKYGAVVIKMYPPFLERRYIKESFILRSLQNYQQAPVLAFDDQKHTMLMKRVIPGDYIDFDSDKELVAGMFRDMTEKKMPVSQFSDIPEEIVGIMQLTETEYQTARHCGYYPEKITKLVAYARKVYAEYFAAEEKYLLHGDAYYKNTLHTGTGVALIDPVGYQDAYIFEYMPMLTYELVFHTKEHQYAEKYRQLLGFFEGITNTEKFNAAVFVFLVKQLVPSIYEANDGYKRADQYMEAIDALFVTENDDGFVLSLSR